MKKLLLPAAPDFKSLVAENLAANNHIVFVIISRVGYY